MSVLVDEERGACRRPRRDAPTDQPERARPQLRRDDAAGELRREPPGQRRGIAGAKFERSRRRWRGKRPIGGDPCRGQLVTWPRRVVRSDEEQRRRHCEDRDEDAAKALSLRPGLPRGVLRRLCNSRRRFLRGRRAAAARGAAGKAFGSAVRSEATVGQSSGEATIRTAWFSLELRPRSIAARAETGAPKAARIAAFCVSQSATSRLSSASSLRRASKALRCAGVRQLST